MISVFVIRVCYFKTPTEG